LLCRWLLVAAHKAVEGVALGARQRVDRSAQQGEVLVLVIVRVLLVQRRGRFGNGGGCFLALCLAGDLRQNRRERILGAGGAVCGFQERLGVGVVGGGERLAVRLRGSVAVACRGRGAGAQGE
jgi:hypothetical protein